MFARQAVRITGRSKKLPFNHKFASNAQQTRGYAEIPTSLDGVVTGVTGKVKKQAAGLLVLGGGIAFLTLNERRAVKQLQLERMAAKMAIDVDFETGEPRNPARVERQKFLRSNSKLNRKPPQAEVGKTTPRHDKDDDEHHEHHDDEKERKHKAKRDLDEDDDEEDDDEEDEDEEREIHSMLENMLIYGHGKVRSSDSDPMSDPDFWLTVPTAIKLKRKVDMFQWVEHQHQHKNKRKNSDGSVTEETTYTYTYTKEWCSYHKTVSHDSSKTNPSFPENLQSGSTKQEAEMIVMGGKDWLLGTVLRRQLENYVPVELKSDLFKDGWKDKAAQYDLAPTKDRKMFYTKRNRSSWSSPKVGDVRVRFWEVPAGEYTVVTKLTRGRLKSFHGQLKDSLASQGDIKTPELLKDVLEEEGIPMKTFIIPESVINQMEKLVLSMVPLRINQIEYGNLSRKEMFAKIHQDDEANKWLLRFLGSAITILGCTMIIPLAVTSGSAWAGGAVSGAIMSWQAISTAESEAQVAAKIKQRKEREGDVAL